MLQEVWRELRTTLLPLTARVNAQEHRIELVTGAVLDLWSLDNPDVARGRRYARVILDEAALVRDLERAWQQVIRPTLTDFEGDAWFLSTPKGLNFFHALWQLGQDPASRQAGWRSWRFSTASNPHLPAAEIARARQELPERVFAQEYLAKFVADTAGVFRRVLANATAAWQERAVPGHQYVVGVDWAKHEDFTVFAVIDCTLSALVHLDRFQQIDYTVQRGRLAALVERFRPRTIVAERNAMGEPILEDLLRAGLPVQPFTTTQASKAAAIEALALAFERDALQIVPDPVLISELEAYETVRTPGGLLRYTAPAGLHDDCVMALALAWTAARPDASPRVWTIGGADW
jgi:phage FluMu gp28-like protein